VVRLGWIDEEGKGVPKNTDMAATLFQRAARFGSDIAQDLTQRYKMGKEVLPPCVKGSIVEKGSAERSASVTELAALSNHTARSRNPVAGAARTKIVNHVIAEARKYKLDPRLVLAVMSTESAFNPNARSDRNAFGLMQIIPETAERFGVTDIMDPVQNIRGGMAYLRWLLNYYRGDVSLVLAAYNAGPGAVEEYGGIPPFTDTQNYVQQITQKVAQAKSGGGGGSGGDGSRGSKILAMARSKLGKPYVWGAASDDVGYDCSGLVQVAYAAAGIELAHSSATQCTAGSRVSQDQAQPGDLVCWDGHVAIYAGNSTVVEAATEGIPVRETTVYQMAGGPYYVHIN